jgi:pimeloyl-ACP methyl ester carboxylesterase
MRKLLFLVGLIIISAAFAYTAHNDIEYYPSGEAPQLEKNMLDIYVPSGATAGKPVIFFAHGGTWMFNDRSDFVAVGTQLSDGEDFVVVIPSYRLSDSLHPENTHPCHIEDIAQAFAWTVENISAYQGDPEKIIVMGHSAGGHLAVLLSTNTFYLENAGAEIDDILGVVNFSMGIYDIPKLYSDIGFLASMGYSMIGFDRVFGPIADSSANWYDASPRYHVGPNTPPTIHFVSVDDMEQIIGGDFGGYGFVILPGEIQFVYDHYNLYHPTDTFWIDGDHDTGFATFIFSATCRARYLTMAFIDGLLTGIDEKKNQIPEQMSITAYPNPFNSACKLTSSGDGIFEIYDVQGKLIDLLVCANGDAVWRPSEETPAGVYLIKTKSGLLESISKVTYLK